ncbi:LysR substrate-binding domain-containing protein [Actinomadura atramentaria]|uniref:LysR substrate-binding domain-containing protein n=1 Tax=Actinomadura atramentaria TaxID=1990 RepID=UPI00037AC70D|nr:LysR substrate-binding domain-containing protein [Actinomadura atramentaria]
MERAEADLAASLDEITGVLRIAVFQTAALALLPGALTRLRGRHPALRVQVRQVEPEAALPALLARDFDLAITEAYPGTPPPRPSAIEYEELCRDEIRLALPPGREPGDGLRAAADGPWVLEPSGTAARAWALTLCRGAGFEPDVRFESSDLLLHLRLVEEGHAAALIPDLVWTTGTRPVPLVRLPAGRRTRRLYTASRRGGGGHPAIGACRAALRATARARA